MLMSQLPLPPPLRGVLTQVRFEAAIETVERVPWSYHRNGWACTLVPIPFWTKPRVRPWTRRGSRTSSRMWASTGRFWMVSEFCHFKDSFCMIVHWQRSYGLAGCVEDNPMLVTQVCKYSVFVYDCMKYSVFMQVTGCEKLGFWCLGKCKYNR